LYPYNNLLVDGLEQVYDKRQPVAKCGLSAGWFGEGGGGRILLEKEAER
jgi:hypothetical protein